MIPAGFLLAMNLFWFGYSTTRVQIGGPGLAQVTLRINEEVIELGDLRRGESRFMFLPKHGDAIYSITFQDNGHEQAACELEIQEVRQHVETMLRPGSESSCVVSEPMFSGLLVGKFF